MAHLRRLEVEERAVREVRDGYIGIGRFERSYAACRPTPGRSNVVSSDFLTKKTALRPCLPFPSSYMLSNCSPSGFALINNLAASPREC
jgi:hypothetical protein